MQFGQWITTGEGEGLTIKTTYFMMVLFCTDTWGADHSLYQQEKIAPTSCLLQGVKKKTVFVLNHETVKANNFLYASSLFPTELGNVKQQT